MTLRVRLLLGLVVLAAIGLTVAGGVTYRQTRADLLGRVNQQLATSSQSPNLFFHGFDRSDENLTHALLPPGTWAQVRASGSGQILDTNPGVVSGASPALPATVSGRYPPSLTWLTRAPISSQRIEHATHRPAAQRRIAVEGRDDRAAGNGTHHPAGIRYRNCRIQAAPRVEQNRSPRRREPTRRTRRSVPPPRPGSASPWWY